MLVSHKYKFIFLKSIKTASTSAFVFFAPYCLPQESLKNYKFEFQSQEDYVGVYNEGIIGKIFVDPETKEILFKKKHIIAENVKKIVDEIDGEIWKKYFKITIIRNPWDLMVSLYFQRLLDYPDQMKNLNFYKFIKLLYDKKEVEGHLFYKIGENYPCDYHIRYERLMKDVRYVCEKCNIENFNLDNFKNFRSDVKPKNLDYRSMYNKETGKMVELLYASDIEKFKYTFNNSKFNHYFF
jgi:hypothetical protein